MGRALLARKNEGIIKVGEDSETVEFNHQHITVPSSPCSPEPHSCEKEMPWVGLDRLAPMGQKRTVTLERQEAVGDVSHLPKTAIRKTSHMSYREDRDIFTARSKSVIF